MAINYPKGSNNIQPKKPDSTKKIKAAGRGMDLEKMLNHANNYYLQRKLAVIYKKPTPLKIVSVDYPKRSAAKITEAYFATPSTTDYNGTYKGRYIDFDAKETRQEKSFPLKNFHSHQINHLRAILVQKGVAFVIIRFVIFEINYLFPAAKLIEIYDQAGRGLHPKSIGLDEIENFGYEIPSNLQIKLDYLAAVDDFLEDEQQSK